MPFRSQRRESLTHKVNRYFDYLAGENTLLRRRVSEQGALLHSHSTRLRQLEDRLDRLDPDNPAE